MDFLILFNKLFNVTLRQKLMMSNFANFRDYTTFVVNSLNEAFLIDLDRKISAALSVTELQMHT